MKKKPHISYADLIALLEGEMEPKQEFLCWDHIENCYKCAKAVGLISNNLFSSPSVSSVPSFEEIEKFVDVSNVKKNKKSVKFNYGLEKFLINKIISWFKTPIFSSRYIVSGAVAVLVFIISLPAIKYFNSFDTTFKTSKVTFVLDPVDQPIVIKTSAPEDTLLSLYNFCENNNATIIKVVSLARNQDMVVIKMDYSINKEKYPSKQHMLAFKKNFLKKLSNNFKENIDIPNYGFNDKKGNVIILIENIASKKNINKEGGL